MDARKRLWIGVTLLIAVTFNYALIGVPLLSRSYSINQKARSIMAKQEKPAGMFNNNDDEYLLEVFRKERSAIERKMTILNAVAASLTIFISSWMLFGLIFRRK